MPAITDITGRVFGRLTVIERAGSANNRALWRCRCECGNEHITQGQRLRNGKVKSCGCLRAERVKLYRLTHGDARKGMRTRLHRIWTNMLARCRNTTNPAFDRYGGRGITIEWPNYETFRDWALANGYADDLSVDRIDNDGPYSPNNCRWATTRIQVHNSTSISSVMRSDGRRFECIVDASVETGCHRAHISAVCRGKRKSAGGYGWRYDQESNSNTR